MQMTSLTTLVFADVSLAERNAASTLMAMLVQTASAAGVALAAFLLALFEQVYHVNQVQLPELHASFFTVGILAMFGAAVFLRMPSDIGREVSLHKAAARS